MFVEPPPDIRLSVTIMYAGWDDWRTENAEAIYDQLDGHDDIVQLRTHACSQDRILWEDAKECWADGRPEAIDATHHTVIQGDVELCDGYADALTSALAAVPHAIVSPFSMYDECKTAHERGVPWAKTTGMVWGQAPVVPTRLIGEFLDWSDQFFAPDAKHDDWRLTCWNCLEGNTDIWMTVPSLVEHLGHDQSVAGNNPPIDRTAALYAGDMDIDVRDIEWSCPVEAVPVRKDSRRSSCLDSLDLE